MRLTPDALLLGPLALSWPNLALLLGVVAFTSLTARKGLEAKAGWVLLVTLLSARLGFALEHYSSWPNPQAALLATLDIRSGDWNWLLGLLGGLVMAVLLLRQKAIALLVAGVVAVAIAVLPLGIQRSLNHSAQPGLAGQLEAKTLEYLEPGLTQPRPARWGDLPKPMLVNVWATWCPPCRAEMPLLAEYQQKGYPIVLLNAGETWGAVKSFLQERSLSTRVFLDSQGLQQDFQVSGLPTTLLIGTDGQVHARHLGPLNRVQLELLLRQLQ